MKNLILGLAMMISLVGVGQDLPNAIAETERGGTVEVVNIEGVGQIEVGGLYSFTALNRDFPAFKEIIDEAVRVLAANGIEFKDQFNTDSEFEFIDPDQAEFIHFNIVRGGSVQISWLISYDDEKATLAYLFLETTGFRFEVESRYI